MKKLLALLLLFGIVGCATVFKDEQSKTMALMYPASSYGYINVDNYEDMKSYWRAEAMNLETGEKLFYGSDSSTSEPGQVFDILEWVINKCENRITKWGGKQDLGIRCVLSRYQDKIYYQDLDSYKRTAKKRTSQWSINNKLMSDDQFKKLKQVKKARQDREKEQKEIILAGLISRCENFGWSDEDSVAACIQQEAYRDLQIEKQKYEIKLLEKKLVTAQTQTQTQVVDDEPLFFMFLNAYAKAKEKESLNQMKRDISSLKSQARYLKNKDNTKFALDVLYRDNN
tara:strand:+ start:757 stop:1611 length:855 start_codon:yes stop_codon:yes gene_type:complete